MLARILRASGDGPPECALRSHDQVVIVDGSALYEANRHVPAVYRCIGPDGVLAVYPDTNTDRWMFGGSFVFGGVLGADHPLPLYDLPVPETDHELITDKAAVLAKKVGVDKVSAAVSMYGRYLNSMVSGSKDADTTALRETCNRLSFESGCMSPADIMSVIVKEYQSSQWRPVA